MGTPATQTTCVKCAGPMEFGLLVDSMHGAPGYSGPERILEWVRGSPRRTLLVQAFKTEPGDRLQVATLRCTSCGYVELYAPQDEGAPT